MTYNHVIYPWEVVWAIWGTSNSGQAHIEARSILPPPLLHLQCIGPSPCTCTWRRAGAGFRSSDSESESDSEKTTMDRRLRPRPLSSTDWAASNLLPVSTESFGPGSFSLESPDHIQLCQLFKSSPQSVVHCIIALLCAALIFECETSSRCAISACQSSIK